MSYGDNERRGRDGGRRSGGYGGNRERSFGGGNRSGDRGGRSFGGDRGGYGGRRFDRPREMHKVKCAECGKECEVPFKPTEGRPVYCRECFQNHREDRPRRQRYNDEED
ncbi:hypothetical protein KO465_05315 [Candidatus Micrarchaeota archaeon]|nr:hypothetical protein [Candidatus Micrarchaeota archaeon]